MKKDNYKNIILDHHDVENKIKRISLEILEDNIDQKKLIFFGVSKNGKIIAKKIINLISEHSEIDFEMVGVEIDLYSLNHLKFEKDFTVKEFKAFWQNLESRMACESFRSEHLCTRARRDTIDTLTR